MTKKTPLSEKIATEEAIKTFKNSMGKEWIEVKDVRASIQNILEDLRKDWEAEDGCLDWSQITDKFEKHFGTLADKEENGK